MEYSILWRKFDQFRNNIYSLFEKYRENDLSFFSRWVQSDRYLNTTTISWFDDIAWNWDREINNRILVQAHAKNRQQ